MLFYDKNIDLRVKKEQVEKKCKDQFMNIEEKCRNNVQDIESQLKKKY